MKKLSVLLMTVVSILGVVPFVSADAPTEAREGRAELRFLEGMIDHHQMALDMALDCLDNASSEDVKAICQDVIDAQTPEIEQMQAWLLAWYNVEYLPMSMQSMNDMMGDMDGMGNMDGMNHSGMAGMPYTDPAMMMGMFAGLNRLEGKDYDIAWLESMIDHHDDAIHMSERLLARLGDGGHSDLKELAQNIIDAQTAEITVMEDLILNL